MSQTKAELVNGLSINAAAADALTINSDGDITFTGAAVNLVWDKSTDDLIFADNAKAAFGTSSDLNIYFDGSNSYIKEPAAVAGQLIIDGWNGTDIRQGETGDLMGRFVGGGAVELYNDNSKKFNTNSGGVDISGHCYFPDNNGSYYGTGEDFRIYHNATNSEIKNLTGLIYIESDGTTITDKEGSDVMASFAHDGAVNLYYDNVSYLDTYSGGVNTKSTHKITGLAGGNATLLMYADNAGQNADYWKLASEHVGNGFTIASYASGGWQTVLRATDSRTIELHYQDSKKLETNTYGIIVTGVGEIQGNSAANYVNHTFNDGNNNNRYGSYIKCGTDDASGTNYALGVSDGDGGTQGYLTFSGGTLALDPFTAAHPCIVPDADNPSDESMAYPYGTLLETITIEYKKKKDGSDTERGILYKVQKTQSANSKKVLGAYAGSLNNGPDNHTNMHHVYVLGDGHILVNNAGGNIEVGDGICSSATAGIGQKATANPSMIIGIAQEAITFTGSETKLVAVQYGLQQFIPWT